MNAQLIEIASWRIVAELYRRYPGKFHVIETHPGGGQYDCLSLYDRQTGRLVADFNRRGGLHFHDTGEAMDIWQELLVAPTPKPVLDEVCRRLGLPMMEHVPPSTPQTLVYRFIATFLTHAAFGIRAWDCRNGFYDTSGYGGGTGHHFFEDFPEAQRRLEVRLKDDVSGEPAYRFWFLCRDHKPLLCLETVGLLWVSGDSTTYQLMDLYNRHGRRIWPAVVSVGGAFMA
ncbi:MAG: hypothetical protein Kow0047_31520 [Anaerolineae bacterium]